MVAERDGGLTEIDREYVKGLVPRLEDDHYVSSIQDVDSQPAAVRLPDQQGR